MGAIVQAGPPPNKRRRRLLRPRYGPATAPGKPEGPSHSEDKHRHAQPETLALAGVGAQGAQHETVARADLAARGEKLTQSLLLILAEPGPAPLHVLLQRLQPAELRLRA